MNTRHISAIKNLPIHELNDEEIVKAAMHRLKSKVAILIYMDDTNQPVMLGRYRNARGKWLYQTLLHLWRSYATGKRITNKNTLQDVA